MPLVFPPVANSATTLVELSVAIIANVFLLLWAVSLRKNDKESQYKSILLFLTSLMFVWSIIVIFLPGIQYVAGPEFRPMDVVVGFLYALFRYGYISDILLILLGTTLFAFGRETKGNYGDALTFTGFFVICGSLLSSMNYGFHGFLVWTGAQSAAPYFESTYQIYSSVANVLSQTSLFILLYIGVKEKKYPLLLVGITRLSIPLVLLVLNRSSQLFLQLSSSLILFGISLLLIHYFNMRELPVLEMV
jgi:hypothetical protein